MNRQLMHKIFAWAVIIMVIASLLGSAFFYGA
jgi:hypothetical protein